MSEWKPMSTNSFPWNNRNVILMVFDKDNPSDIEIFRCRCGEHGAYFPHGSMVTINEEGWIPYAWREDDTPARDDEKFPPMWTDYLTEQP